MRKKRKYQEELEEEQEDIYTEEGREAQLYDDEIDDWEAGFMAGYEDS